MKTTQLHSQLTGISEEDLQSNCSHYLTLSFVGEKWGNYITNPEWLPSVATVWPDVTPLLKKHGFKKTTPKGHWVNNAVTAFENAAGEGIIITLETNGGHHRNPRGYWAKI